MHSLCILFYIIMLILYYNISSYLSQSMLILDFDLLCNLS